MDKIKTMTLFTAVVEQGSFAGAARQVGLTPAMVGRRIAALEAELGFVLLNRSTRQMQLTPGGQAYYEGCLRILGEVTELEESLLSEHQIRPKGLITLSAPDGLGSPYLVEAIGDFRRQYPAIRFDLRLTNEPLDLVEARIDLAVRLAFELADSSLVATPLGHTGFGLYASADYLAARGTPGCLADLKAHDCLHMGASRYGDYWRVIADGKPVNFRQPWALTVPSTECLAHALCEGMGIAMLPALFAAPLVATGKVVEIAGVVEFPRLTVYGIYPTRKHLPYRVRLFLDFLKGWMVNQLAG